MAENKKVLPKFESIDDLVTFFDENDMGEYLEDRPDVPFEMESRKGKHFVEVDDDLIDQISEISRKEHVSSGVIVNTWLRERLSGQARQK